MRRRDLSRARAVAALAAVGTLALIVAGAGPLSKKRSEPPPPKAEETVGDLASVVRRPDTKLEGVGLVVGLDNTGADPPRSSYRDKLIAEMRKDQVDRPNELLKNPKVSMVLVHMTVPAGVSPSDRLDVEVEVPPACGTRSLAGGYLLQTRLREVTVLDDRALNGNEAAFAQGPVMIGSAGRPTDAKVGRVLGGGRVRREVPFRLILKENRQSAHVSKMVEGVVNQRFPQTEVVNQKGVANAKTPEYLVLKVPRIYHQDQDRFFRVVKLLPMVDTPDLRERRTAAWGRELLNPETAGLAALRLEGLGVTAVDALKGGLASPSPQVRFFASEALAYLNDPSGVEVLAETARTLPDFRPHALSALASTDQAAFHMQLRKLMDEPDAEVRYGAFNALRTLSPQDYGLGRVRVLNDPDEEPSDEGPADAMAAAITAGRRRPKVEDPFALYIVDCEGPPMVHVSRSRRSEVVVFGRGMKLLPPVVLGTGPLLLNAADGDDSVQISKIVPGAASDADQKVTSSLDLGEVLRQAANLGASYPDLVAILQAAQRQQNLPGPLVMDAVPGARSGYYEAAFLGKDKTAKKDDAVTPAKFDSSKSGGLFNRLRQRLSGK
jgi:flagellar basal body P-ring protein FlgI